jgi:hypothetical protein
LYTLLLLLTWPLAAAAFIPTLEKFGKSAQVLISPDSVSFVQTPLEADGAQVCVRFQAVSGLLLLTVCLQPAEASVTASLISTSQYLYTSTAKGNMIG